VHCEHRVAEADAREDGRATRTVSFGTIWKNSNRNASGSCSTLVKLNAAGVNSSVLSHAVTHTHTHTHTQAWEAT
jgi:hypothetical protein